METALSCVVWPQAQAALISTLSCQGLAPNIFCRFFKEVTSDWMGLRGSTIVESRNLGMCASMHAILCSLGGPFVLSPV